MAILLTREGQGASLNPEPLLQQLIRFYTTNLPGNGRECVAYLSNLLAKDGCDSTIVGSSPDRPDRTTRLRARAEDLHIPADVILTFVSDEEGGRDAARNIWWRTSAACFNGFATPQVS